MSAIEQERVSALASYHEQYGCIECGGRELGCTPTHCCIDIELLRELGAVEFNRLLQRVLAMHRAVTHESIRRVFDKEE